MSSSTCVVLALCLSCLLAGQTIAQDAPPTAAEVPEPEPESAAASSPAPALLPPAVELPPEDAALNDALLAAELQKLGLDDISSGGAVDTSLRLSGFVDFSLMSLFGRAGDWRGAFERFPAFSVGNFNLYIDKSLSQTLRMFGEVRLSFLPNGTAPPGSAPGDYQSTASEDYANFKRPVRWGGIIIPRVYLEWAPFRFFGVRAGVFLTPYGIWNVDHGSPTIIPVQRPLAVGVAMFPERQTGLEVLGQFDISNHSTIGYHLTVSNGVGPVDEYRDLDANKAVGARVYWTYDGFGQLRVGGSMFYGTDTSAHERAGFAPDGKHVEFTQEVERQLDVLALAGDVQWKYGGLLLQAELITQQQRYNENARPGATNPFFGRYLAPSDRLNWGVYGLFGYRLPWFGVMPYVLAHFMDSYDPAPGVVYYVTSFFAGINVRPIDVLVIKIEYNHSHFPRGFIIAGDTRLGQVQLAWAF